VPANEKERLIHPERAATVRKYHDEVGEIHPYIIG
jgi:hypothetical protein